MQETAAGTFLYSASDVVHFLDCEHLTSLDLRAFAEDLPKTKDDEQAILIQEKGLSHESAVVEKLRAQHASFIDIAKVSDQRQAKANATIQAMREGIEIIFQATFLQGEWLGYADFLRRTDTSSALGDYSYEVLDTKLARSVKAKFVIQLAFYSDLLANIQGRMPQKMYVVLGDGQEVGLRCADYAEYYARLKTRFLSKVHAPAQDTYPQPCSHCDLCHWRDLCAQQWKEDDHLSLVANILSSQIRKLEDAGVQTLQDLAQMDVSSRIPRIAAPVLKRLHNQARLQFTARRSGQGMYELIEPQPEDPPEQGPRGLARLPAPDPGDLFFDMEGNPLEDGGLEYLFGLYLIDSGKPVFLPFWAHSRAEEKSAFEAFMDFATQRLKTYPKAHIYHYAPYEVTALKKLMGLHGTRELEVDKLLREHKMVDLYRVVREGVRVSEPRYSIKNMEHFYLEKRAGAVTNAGASIVYYEKWKQTQDPQLLQDIADYNEQDVRSTLELRNWLLKLRPKDLPWVSYADPDKPEDVEARSIKAKVAEERLEHYRGQLLASIPDDAQVWTSAQQHRVLISQLLDFHRRTAKPEWWGVFDRQAMSLEERLENPECLAGFTEQIGNAVRDAQSMRYTFRYPEQELKLKTGDGAILADSLRSVGGLQIDEEQRTVSFKISDTTFIEAGQTDIAASKVVNTDVLVQGLYRYADAVIAGGGKYNAIDALLQRAAPQVNGHAAGTPLAPDQASVGQIADVVSAMQQSYIFIQGPPGAGKTYTGSHVILTLLQAGKRVGVTSNSHKAIINLLHAVEKEAKAQSFSFTGAKKSSSDPSDQIRGSLIKDFTDTTKFNNSGAQLIAGTAWAMAHASLDQTLDYLFVDEAGQMSLGNLVPAATSAKNIVLLGDQMQLSQPTKGVHPGESGLSVLDFLLKDQATIAPDKGIFLGTTWRMHPKVCQFISDAVYDGRLFPQSRNAQRQLVLSPDAHPALLAAGIRFMPVSHEACTQHSTEEVRVVKALFESLLNQSYTDEHGSVHPMTAKNILVVSPYNMQVNKLSLSLPVDARVGTVDKFQGQEAEVVIVSMATSSGDDLPRDIEFLFSKNRLNVAISRAKSVAILVASPALMDVNCKTAEQMALVNTLCWLASVGS